MTQGGPGNASETINLYLYQTAFAYYDVGYGSAIASVFFVIIVALSLIALHFADARRLGRAGAGGEMNRKTLRRAGLMFAAFVLLSPAVLFFIWMLSLSLQMRIDNSATPPILIPTNVAWSNYADVFNSNRFFLYFRNSLIVTGLGDAHRARRRRAGRLGDRG